MDLCTFFTIWDTDRVLYNCRHPTIFGTLVIFHSTVFLISLSLVSKLKLNTRVLKYSKYSPKSSSTPWGTQILEYSMTVLSKVLIYRVLPSSKRPRITQIPCVSHKYGRCMTASTSCPSTSSPSSTATTCTTGTTYTTIKLVTFSARIFRKTRRRCRDISAQNK